MTHTNLTQNNWQGASSNYDIDRNKERRNKTVSQINIKGDFYLTEPIINLLTEESATLRQKGIELLGIIPNREVIRQLRKLSLDTSYQIRSAVTRKLKPIEMFYRRKFSFFQDRIKRHPDLVGYKFGFALVCYRYAQMWVEDKQLQSYFLRQALKTLNQIIRAYQPKIRYFYFRGHILCELGHDKLAIEDFKKVLTYNSHHTGAILALVDLYLSIHKPHKITQLLKGLNKKKMPPSFRHVFNFWLES